MSVPAEIAITIIAMIAFTAVSIAGPAGHQIRDYTRRVRARRQARRRPPEGPPPDKLPQRPDGTASAGAVRRQARRRAPLTPELRLRH